MERIEYLITFMHSNIRRGLSPDIRKDAGTDNVLWKYLSIEESFVNVTTFSPILVTLATVILHICENIVQ